jgi:hypothetical protein
VIAASKSERHENELSQPSEHCRLHVREGAIPSLCVGACQNEAQDPLTKTNPDARTLGETRAGVLTGAQMEVVTPGLIQRPTFRLWASVQNCSLDANWNEQYCSDSRRPMGVNCH